MSWTIILSLLFVTIILSSINKQVWGATEDFGGGVARVCYGNSTDPNNFTNGNFEDNVYALLSVLENESSKSNPPLRFFNTSVGRVTDRAYGSYFCRGDLSPSQCHHCLIDVNKFISDLDIDHPECFAFDFLARCIVQYGNSPDFSVYEEGLDVNYQPLGTYVSNYEQYNMTLTTTIEDLIREAGYGNSIKANFAAREVEVTGSKEKIFVLVQCTPDISAINCGKCLGELYAHLPDCCNGTQGGVLAHANCLMKFDNQTFFGSSCHNSMPGYLHVTLVLLLIMYTFL